MAKVQREALSRRAELAALVRAQREDLAGGKRDPRVVELPPELGEQVGAEPPAPRVSPADAPEDYDAELGLIVDRHEPEHQPSEAEADRWVTMATDIIGRLGQSSRYRGHMPITRPPIEAKIRVDPSLLRALPELEALHRALFPGWRAIVELWLEINAKARLEAKHRELRARLHRAGDLVVNALPPRQVASGADLLATLKRNPPDLMGAIPAALTAELLTFLGDVATRGGGRHGGGLTPKRAVRLLDGWLVDTHPIKAARAALKADEEKRAKRQKKGQKPAKKRSR